MGARLAEPQVLHSNIVLHSNSVHNDVRACIDTCMPLTQLGSGLLYMYITHRRRRPDRLAMSAFLAEPQLRRRTRPRLPLAEAGVLAAHEQLRRRQSYRKTSIVVS